MCVCVLCYHMCERSASTYRWISIGHVGNELRAMHHHLLRHVKQLLQGCMHLFWGWCLLQHVCQCRRSVEQHRLALQASMRGLLPRSVYRTGANT